MDRHEVPGVTPEDVAAAHAADVGIEHEEGVRFLTYWFDDDAGSVWCLAEGPDRDAVEEVHRRAHGLLATTIVEVEPSPLRDFFGNLPAHPVGDAYVDSAIRAVMFTDIVGSTELTQRLGDDAGTALVREHDRIVRGALDELGGREVKHTGDGIMASFQSVASAVRAAMAIQATLAERNVDAELPLRVRVGISAGEPLADGSDLFGSAVQLAARLCESCAPDGVRVSLAVKELCIGKGIRFTDAGPLDLKGFPEPTPVFDVELP